MTKEDFKALGLDDEAAEKCAKASGEELAGYVAKAKLDIAEQARETLELQAKESAKQIAALKKSVGDTEKLTQAIADLQEAGKKAKADYEGKLKTLQVDYAVDAALDAAKARNKKAVTALLDRDAIEIGENGKVKGLDAQIKKLMEAEDTAFLFDKGDKPDPKDGKPTVDLGDKNKAEQGKDSGEGQNKPSIGSVFASAYNKLVAPSGSDGGEGKEG